MGCWLIGADALAGGRFVVSPLAETVAALKALQRRAAPAHPGERTWLDAHLPAYAALLAADPVTAQLVRAALGRTWNADFLTPPPSGDGYGSEAFEQELERVRGTAPATARADLTVSLGGPLPAALERGDLPERMAGLLEWVWRETVLPYWPRRRRALEADVVGRTAQLARDGWAAALNGLRPGMRWLGDGRLQINTYDNPPRELCGAQLMFVPVTPRQAWVAWDTVRDTAVGSGGPRRYAVVYPCSGVLADSGAGSAPGALGALLGPSRAAVLVRLDTPLSTTQLVALTGQGLGAVGRHLKVLLDARLVHRRRSGRSVLYCRTDAGEALVHAQRSG